MDASKSLNIDDYLHLCQMSKFFTLSTCKLETKSFVDTVFFTIIDQNKQALVIFFLTR